MAVAPSRMTTRSKGQPGVVLTAQCLLLALVKLAPLRQVSQVNYVRSITVGLIAVEGIGSSSK